MTTLDQAGRPPLPVNLGRMDEATGPSQKPEEQDFGQWISQEVRGAGISQAGSTTDRDASNSMPPQTNVQSTLEKVEMDTVAVLYAWQLHSQVSLSQLASTATVRLGQTAGTSVTQGQTQASPPYPHSGRVMRAATASAESTPESHSSGVVSANGTSSVASRESARARDAISGALTPALWTERMLRSVQLPDRSITLWLRDYRLSHSEMPAVIEELLQTHPDRGRVARIVVNGNEVWRSESTESRSG